MLRILSMAVLAAALSGCGGGLFSAPRDRTATATGSSGSTAGSGSTGGGSTTGAGTTATTAASTGSTSTTGASTGGTSATSGTTAGSTSTSGTTGVAHAADITVVGSFGATQNSAFYDVAIGPDGSVYGADLGDNALVVLGSGSGVIVAGGNQMASHQDGAGTSAALAHPWGMVFIGTTLYFIDSGDSGSYAYLRTFDSNRNVNTVCGSGLASTAANGACTVASFDGPAGLATDGANSIFVADYGESRIQRIDLSGQQVSTWVGSSSPGDHDAQGVLAQLRNPSAVAVDGQGHLWIADFGNSKIKKVDSAQNVTTFAALPNSGPVSNPRPFGVAVDAQGNVYASDVDNGAIDRWSADGTLTGEVLLDTSYGAPAGMKIDSQGHLLVATVSGSVLQVSIP